MIRLVPFNQSGLARKFGAALVCAVFALGVSAAQPGVKNANASGVGNLPLYFEPTDANSTVQFTARGRLSGFSIAPNEATLTLSRFEEKAQRQVAGPARNSGRYTTTRSLWFEFVGANPNAQVAGESALSGTANYFIGNDPAKWRTAVPLFERVRVTGLYPGVNLVYYGNEQQLEYDFVVAPGTNPDCISIRINGADKMHVDGAGDLVIQLGDQTIRQPKPVIYQVVNGTRQSVNGGYQLAGNRVAFRIADYDRSLPLVIDPILSYSSYYGGSGLDLAWAVATDPNGNLYVAGETMGGLPINPGVTITNQFDGPKTVQGLHGDAFVAKFANASSNVIYLAHIGGTLHEVGISVAVDETGNAYLTGYTDSTNFPVENALFPTISGTFFPPLGFPIDAFVTKLGSQGTNLLYSTYLGGEGVDEGIGIAIDGAGNAYIAGYTESTNIPYATYLGSAITNKGGGDGFFAKIAPNGASLINFTYLNGTNLDVASDIAATDDGTAYVAGYTQSRNFPISSITNVPQPYLAGGMDAFFAIFRADNTFFSTYLGGSGDNTAYRITTDANSNFYITGATREDPSFPIAPSKLNPGGIARSDNNAGNWTNANLGLASIVVPAIAIDPINPLNIYAATWRGIVRSSDGGAIWFGGSSAPTTNGFATAVTVGVVLSLAIDPSNPANIYAGTSSEGVYFSTNFGAFWTLSRTGLVNQTVNAMAVSGLAPTNIFAGTLGGVYRSTNSAGRWSTINSGLGNFSVRALAFDPSTASTLYAGTAGGVFRTTNATVATPSWTGVNSGLANLSVQALAVDPVTPTTIYAGTARGIFKSGNRGGNWTNLLAFMSTTNGFTNVTALAIDPAVPTTIYAGATNGVFKSMDAGITWAIATNGMMTNRVLSLAINPQSPSILYAGLHGKPFFGDKDVFVFKSSPAFPLYSAVFGGTRSDEGWDVTTDSAENVYLVGATTSTNFPTAAIGTMRGTNSGGTSDAFVAKLNSAGDELIYSVYLGGTKRDLAYGVAVDATGSAYVVGETDSANFPTVSPIQSQIRGNRDAFIAKISSGTLAPIPLNETLSGTNIVLSWSALSPEFVLQSNLSLTNAAGWSNVAAPVVVTNGLRVVTLPATNSAMFFRLRAQ